GSHPGDVGAIAGEQFGVRRGCGKIVSRARLLGPNGRHPTALPSIPSGAAKGGSVMQQTVRVEQFWVDRRKMIAYGRLSIGFGEWNVEMFAPLGQVQPMIQLLGDYVSLDMVGEDGLRYAGVGLVESIETDRGP